MNRSKEKQDNYSERNQNLEENLGRQNKFKFKETKRRFSVLLKNKNIQQISSNIFSGVKLQRFMLSARCSNIIFSLVFRCIQLFNTWKHHYCASYDLWVFVSFSLLFFILRVVLPFVCLFSACGISCLATLCSIGHFSFILSASSPVPHSPSVSGTRLLVQLWLHKWPHL